MKYRRVGKQLPHAFFAEIYFFLSEGDITKHQQILDTPVLWVFEYLDEKIYNHGKKNNAASGSKAKY